ncbi:MULTISPECIES: hypothetical protein [unclassified Mesorhizobium]|uniref:hypothetical protein n=1 Tax=unclassified Mesorhizobium TaxID=325217 RepID=UPI000FCC53F3|nr:MULTISPECIES: hypothetical protein [unclassified Mesorhizobium]RUV57636.1 hypothetical protein EOA85_15495 [Mesorhizobium sp. M5C.F.Ca.IN.020.29.1.1]TIM52777.1 MAG: hypothetical protein E5Y46_31080 [Mesorhizobium sp.]TIM86946.1 MAG: hypothetical protein E5Y50_13890 [Mesorhizobium sp.]TIR28889.1 MAG: hypothetical protein E5X35_28980 [Mesorhizobium sp.]TIS20441.1 MAG: hypothetical protein E5X07_25320 [Mesorhizobium sp.]
MSAFARFAAADCFTGQYKDRTTFIAALLGRLQVEAKNDGWPGTVLFDVDWIEERGQPDMAVISLQPGMGAASVADVRIFLIDKKRAERKAA